MARFETQRSAKNGADRSVEKKLERISRVGLLCLGFSLLGTFGGIALLIYRASLETWVDRKVFIERFDSSFSFALFLLLFVSLSFLAVLLLKKHRWLFAITLPTFFSRLTSRLF